LADPAIWSGRTVLVKDGSLDAAGLGVAVGFGVTVGFGVALAAGDADGCGVADGRADALGAADGLAAARTTAPLNRTATAPVTVAICRMVHLRVFSGHLPDSFHAGSLQSGPCADREAAVRSA
jgi:hypothetical protein